MADLFGIPSLTQERLIWITVVLFGLLIVQRVLAAMRRRRPPKLHPNLQKYGGRSDEEQQADLDASLKIIATSSSSTVAGYKIVRQIEAVFVDGCRAPTEAVTALKAAAARRGANAVINLSQQRTAAGKCSAQGDAVVVKAE